MVEYRRKSSGRRSPKVLITFKSCYYTLAILRRFYTVEYWPMAVQVCRSVVRTGVKLRLLSLYVVDVRGVGLFSLLVAGARFTFNCCLSLYQPSCQIMWLVNIKYRVRRWFTLITFTVAQFVSTYLANVGHLCDKRVGLNLAITVVLERFLFD